MNQTKPKRKVKIKQLRLMCVDEQGNKMTRLIGEKHLAELQTAFMKVGFDFIGTLVTESSQNDIILLNEN